MLLSCYEVMEVKPIQFVSMADDVNRDEKSIRYLIPIWNSLNDSFENLTTASK
jgi:hypothetical protein